MTKLQKMASLLLLGVVARLRDGVQPFSAADDLSARIKHINIDGSRLIPAAVLREAAVSSGIHSEQPPADAPVYIANAINKWYQRNGYVFSRVVARGYVRGSRLQFVVSEPRVASPSVIINYYAAAEDTRREAQPPVAAVAPALPAAPAAATILSQMRQRAAARLALGSATWRRPSAFGSGPSASECVERLEASLRAAREARVSARACERAEARLRALRRDAGLPKPTELEQLHASGALVAVGGSTRPSVVAEALSLRPGMPFRWDARAWDELRRCGLFEACEARPLFVPAPERSLIDPKKGRDNLYGAVFVARDKGAKSLSEQPPSPPVRPLRGSGGLSRWTRRKDEHVTLHLCVIERDSRPRRRSQHCRIEPGLTISGGQIAGEVTLSDHNLFGRNQQLKLDLAFHSAGVEGSELRASWAAPRLGHRFSMGAQVFQRGSGRAGQTIAQAETGGAHYGATASASPHEASAVMGDNGPLSVSPLALQPARSVPVPVSGADVHVNGHAWRGASIGFGAAANLVPTPEAPPPRVRAARSERKEPAWWSRSSLLPSKPPTYHELPVQLSTTLSCGSMQMGGGGGGGGGAAGVRAGARVAVAHSLPLLPRMPNFWRAKTEVRLVVPLGLAFPTRAPRRAPPQPPPEVRATGVSPSPVEQPPVIQLVHRLSEFLLAPAVAATPLAQGAGASAGPLASLVSKLRASTLNVRGRATLAASSLPSYETELLGGENAVRGYESYELGRTTSSVGGTVEVVVPLGGAQPIALSLFGDAGAGTVRPGNAGTNAFSAAAKGVPTGSSSESLSLSGGAAAGMGLRYGPFRIDYAYNLQGRWKAHVGLVEPS